MTILPDALPENERAERVVPRVPVDVEVNSVPPTVTFGVSCASVPETLASTFTLVITPEKAEDVNLSHVKFLPLVEAPKYTFVVLLRPFDALVLLTVIVHDLELQVMGLSYETV